MNELEEKYYSNIKNELLQSAIDKKIDTYLTNRNELTHYYNIGKMIVDAQGGEERAKYGDDLIKKIRYYLTNEDEYKKIVSICSNIVIEKHNSKKCIKDILLKLG